MTELLGQIRSGSYSRRVPTQAGGFIPGWAVPHQNGSRRIDQFAALYQSSIEEALMEKLKSGTLSKPATHRVVVAGSRGFTDYPKFKATLLPLLVSLGWNPELPDQDFEIIQGEAKGPDLMAKEFARELGIPCRSFPAQWHNVEHENAVIKYNRHNQPYNAAAGHNRNAHMAREGTHLVLFWDGKSPGSANMFKCACANALDYVVVRVDVDPAQLPEEHEEAIKRPFNNAIPKPKFDGIRDTCVRINLDPADPDPEGTVLALTHFYQQSLRDRVKDVDVSTLWNEHDGGKARLDLLTPVVVLNEGVEVPTET